MSFFPFEICVAKSIEDPHPTRTPHSESRGFHPPLSSQADIRTETRLNHRERHAPVPDGEVSRRGAEAQRGDRGCGKYRSVRTVFSNCLGKQETPPPSIPRIGMRQDIDPTHPNNLVENATAFSAGGSPAPRWGGLAQRYRACIIFVSGLRLSEKVDGEGSSGSGGAIGLGIERTRDGIWTRETGQRNCIVAVLTQLGSEA